MRDVYRWTSTVDRRSQAVLHDWIVAEVRKRPHCEDFDRDFEVLIQPSLKPHYPSWEIGAGGWERWPPEHRHAFALVVAEGQERFDLR